MQKICNGEARLACGPMYFARITPVPFRGDPNNRLDEPQRFDLEANDELVNI